MSELTPTTSHVGAPPQRDDALLIGTSPMLLPDVCVRCGAPGPHRHRQPHEVSYLSPWLMALGVFTLTLPLLYLAARHPVDVTLSLCARCVARRHTLRQLTLGAGGLSVIALGLSFAGALNMALLGLGLLLAWLCTVTLSQLVKPTLRVVTQVQGRFVLSGAHPRCLESVEPSQRPPASPRALEPETPAGRPLGPFVRGRRSSPPVSSPSGADGSL